MRYFHFHESPLGRMLLVSTADALCGLYFVGQRHYPRIDTAWREDAWQRPIRAATRQLGQYFACEREQFSIRLAPEGTPFQRAVWEAIASVHYGKTISYAQLAQRAGHPKGARAAGTATGRNPISIIIPCHRIVGSDGSLTRYGGGLARKRALLALEAQRKKPHADLETQFDWQLRGRPPRAASATLNRIARQPVLPRAGGKEHVSQNS